MALAISKPIRKPKEFDDFWKEEAEKVKSERQMESDEHIGMIRDQKVKDSLKEIEKHICK